MQKLLVAYLILSIVTAGGCEREISQLECGSYMHNCMNYNTHWGSEDLSTRWSLEYQAIVKTKLNGFVKSIDLTEYRYSGIGCTGSAFLVVSTSYGRSSGLITRYTATAVKGQKDSGMAGGRMLRGRECCL